MLQAAWGWLRETGRVLLEAAPEGYAAADVVAAMTALIWKVGSKHCPGLVRPGWPGRSK
jgi:hypothetical protein